MGYGKTDVNAVQENVKKLNGDGYWYSVPEKGDKVFLCPPWNEAQRIPYREVLIHYNVAMEKIACLKQYGQVCPICEANAELYAMKGDEGAQQLSKDLYAKKNYLYNVIGGLEMQPMGNVGVLHFMPKEQGAVAQIKPWCMGIKLHKMITNFFSINGDIFDPMAGNLIMLTKMNTSNDPKFASTFASAYGAKSRLDDNLLQLLNTNLIDLSLELKPEPYEKLKGMIDAKLASFRAAKAGKVTVQGNYNAVPQQQQFGQNPQNNYVPQQNPVPQQPQYPAQQQQVFNPQNFAGGYNPMPQAGAGPTFTPPAQPQAQYPATTPFDGGQQVQQPPAPVTIAAQPMQSQQPQMTQQPQQAAPLSSPVPAAQPQNLSALESFIQKKKSEGLK